MDNSSSGVQMVVQIIVTIALLVGAAANCLALWILYKSSKTRNSKHVLMLRCLASNDLVAQCGMLLLVNFKKHNIIPVYWQCVLFVCLRAFGIGSGCVALVMAVERWLALTRPFVYQRIVTHQTVKRCIFILWISAVGLTYMPFIGFGIFYNDGKCSRYREANELKDIIYAYIFLLFGSTISFGIVFCNVSIIYELWKIGGSQRIIVRRCSRSPMTKKYATPEEISFAKLMATVCIIFTVCWMPQMISIPLAQFYRDSHFYKIFGKIADLLLCTYFVLDPYIYVLQKYKGRGTCKLSCGKSSNSVSGSQSGSLNGTTVSSSAITVPLQNIALNSDNI